MLSRSARQRFYLLPLLLVACGQLFLLTGCHNDDAVSPNEKTAAPARLPGEDPHAGPNNVARPKATNK